MNHHVKWIRILFSKMIWMIFKIKIMRIWNKVILIKKILMPLRNIQIACRLIEKIRNRMRELKIYVFRFTKSGKDLCNSLNTNRWMYKMYFQRKD